ncbi:translocation/assembly module TamB domain-containing protein [Ochrovirga pacifica]|uniref:translocation/assembly module TamB domain-containing protein n=1 Tax=Ochrovirga pacifica TaxID=1042376 RepID=UPI000255A034|nr:translocation/assembly module TamB domain-containing protein [Ochrovirga pacifica]
MAISLQFGKVQSVIANRALEVINKQYNVSIQLASLKINPFGKFKINNVLIQDHHQDTLIYAEHLKGNLLDLEEISHNKLSFKNVIVQNVWLNDFKYPDEPETNLTVFSKSFKSNKKSKNPLELSFKNVTTKRLRYSHTRDQKLVVDYYDIGGDLKKIWIQGPNVTIHTDSLNFKDIYGIHYKKLATEFVYTLKEMRFDHTHIITDHSFVLGDVVFSAGTNGYANFVEKVIAKGSFYDSEVSLVDINKVYPYIEGTDVFQLKTEVNGPLNDLYLTKTELIDKDNTTFLIGDFTLKNSINNRDDFWFQGKGASLEVLTQKLTDFVPNLYHNSLPKDILGIEQWNYSGDFFVSKSKLVVNGETVTDLGKVTVDGFVKDLNKTQKKIDLKILQGFVLENDFIKELKRVSFNGKLSGVYEKNNVDLKTDLKLKSIFLKKNKIHNSNLKVHFVNHHIQSSFQIRDSLLNLNASLDYYLQKQKKQYNLEFQIQKAKLSELFPDYINYQKNIVANGQLKVEHYKDSLISLGEIKNLRIDTPSESLKLNEVDLSLLSKPKEKEIQLTSKDLLSLGVKGDFQFSDFEKLVANALYKFIPGSKIRSNIKQQTLTFDLDVYPKFIKSLTDKVTLKDNLVVSGVLDAQGDKGVINASVASFSSKNIEVDSLNVVLDNSNQWINSNISVQKFKFKKQLYQNLSLLGKKVNDTLFVRSNFNSDKIENRAVFYVTAAEDAIFMGIDNVYLKYLNSIWVNQQEADNKLYYNYKTGEWYFYGVSFVNDYQAFEFDGSIKKDKSKNLRLLLKNINLQEILPIVDSLKIEGVASGRVLINERNRLLKPNGDLYVNNFKINGVDYGNLAASLKPNQKDLSYNVDFKIFEKNQQNINAKGVVDVNKDNFAKSKIELDVMLNELKLNSLSPLGRNVLSSIRGEAEGNFKVKGTLDDFNSYGKIQLKNAGLKFPYLNIDYNFTGTTDVALKGKSFVFQNIKLQDQVYGTHGTLTGKINYDKYRNWYLDLVIDSKNLVVLNTNQSEDSKYYGTAFMKGNATIKGLTSDLLVNVVGTTLPNTTFILPISDVKQAENNQFIFYKKSKNKSKDQNELVANQGGVSVNLNIEVTKDAFGEIVIDQTSGSSLQARADGRLLLEIDPNFNIDMYGDLVVDEGMYIFKYGGIINKPFTVKRGGTVSWSGDPFKADLNIEAIHNVKANPKVLLENLSVNRKIDVDLITKVTGELFNSQQEFFIEIPNASSTVVSELDFVLNNDENSKMRQFFSLLASKTFYDENNVSSTSTMLSNTTSELIANAVTEIFNNSDSKLQVNFGYTSGQVSDVENFDIDNQIDIGLATEINERILINGKLGVPVGTRTQSAVIGEVKIEFLLNKDGTLRSSVFNRQNEIQYSEEEQGYTQGVGLNYQIDFNNFSEMLEKIGVRRKKKKKNKTEKELNQEIEDNLIYVLPMFP